MEKTKKLVSDLTENTEQTAEKTQVEEPVKTYTGEEVDAIVGKRLARREAKIRKEYDRKYGRLENVLKAGTGKEDVDELTESFQKFYEGKGIEIPREPEYSEKDLAVLADVEAKGIIQAGLEEVIEETDRLADIGLDNMTARERELFRNLAEYRKKAERGKELEKIGVSKEEYSSEDFQEFASKFNSDIPITDIYSIYNKTKPRKEIKTMGSMKNNTVDNGVKDFYSYEEAVKFSKKDFDKNPALYEAVQQSMLKW